MTGMTEMQLFDLIERAEARERKDDHLTDEERQELVNHFLEVYKDDVPDEFPADESLASQFVYIIYDF